MNRNIALMRKVRGTAADWIYLYNGKLGAFTAVPGEIAYQIGAVLEHILHISDPSDGEDLVAVSPNLNAENISNLNILFPDVTFLPILDANNTQFFHRALAQVGTPPAKKQNQSVLYIGSDASCDSHGGSSAWAWATDGLEGAYAVGEGYATGNSNVTEYQAALNAVTANADASVQRLHVYSDSIVAGQFINNFLARGRIPSIAREYGLVSLSRDAMEVMKVKDVTVEWVRGHRNHRLNQIADTLSRVARQRFNAGLKKEEFALELDVAYQTFNHARL